MERSGNFYKAIRLGYILISILIGCMAVSYTHLGKPRSATAAGKERVAGDAERIGEAQAQP